MLNCCAKLLTFLLLLALCSACTPKKAYKVQVYDSAATKNLKGYQKPYSVNGKLYKPLREHAGYVEEGTASWYGKDFHGKSTSCGEIYDMYAMTSAHKILPLGVHLRVTNLRNDRSVTVRVNDRGPFVNDRIIDLSYAAAKELDIVASGTAPVRIESIEDVGSAAGSAIKLGPYTVQVGAFTNPENAKRYARELEGRYGSSSIQPGWVKGVLFHRVRVGSYAEMEAAERVRKEFEARGTTAAFVVALDKNCVVEPR